MKESIMGLRQPFKRGATWYFEFNRKRLSLRTQSKTEAYKLYNEIKREYLAGRWQLAEEKKVPSLGQFITEYLEWAEAVQPKRTFMANRLALKKLFALEGASKPLDQLGPKTIDRLVADCRKKKLKTNSINNYIRHIRAVLNKSVEWEYLTENPFRRCKELKSTKRPPAYLSAEESRRFLASIEDQDIRRLVLSFLCTGRRRSELLALDWADIDFEHERYLIRRSKTHLARTYPMHPSFRAVLETFADREGRVFKRWQHPDTITGLVKAELIKAGFDKLRLHDLRHSFASNLAEEGIPLQTIGELLGHTDKRTTEIYAHLSDRHLRNSLNKLTLFKP